MPHLAPRRSATTVTAAVIAVPIVAGLAWLTLATHRIEQRYPMFVHAVLHWIGETFGRQWGTLGTADVVANVVAFVPVGVLAYLIIPRRAWIAALLVGPAMATAAEGVQLLFLPARDPSLHDIAAGSVGSTIGVAVAALITLARARIRTGKRPG